MSARPALDVLAGIGAGALRVDGMGMATGTVFSLGGVWLYFVVEQSASARAILVAPVNGAAVQTDQPMASARAIGLSMGSRQTKSRQK